jgi:hypothetical protein
MERDKEVTRIATDRRAFLAAAGKFAVVTPPLMTMLLSTTLTSPAIAASGRGSYQGDQGGPGEHSDQGEHGKHGKHGKRHKHHHWWSKWFS